jgi:acyl carrier protein
MFSDVLGANQVSIHNNFFSELGGHSLLATRLISRIRDTFRFELPLRVIFETPTVAELALTVEQARIASTPLEQVEIQPISRHAYRAPGRSENFASDSASSEQERAGPR